ncbi:hypothetical protein ST47_g4456 [Ascochyta rabiei]|uniref:Uncharacterized protein n=1 Tax=Didymella rabiei TaxID=5454 RepID=A0A163FJA1_DIDRA|nr:hypothetical protein ST47_g4456 [Ascochyta rabiei]
MIDTVTKHSVLSTDVLTDTDKALAISNDPQPEDTPSRAAVSNLTMSHGHVGIWPLDEVGYEHVPAYTHPDSLSNTECCSWLEALQAIEEHDWSFVKQDDRCQSPNNNANHSENISETTLQSLGRSPSTLIQSVEDESSQVPAKSLHGGADYLDLKLADGHQLSPFTSDNDIASECANPSITEMEPCSSYQSIMGTVELQIAHTKSSSHELPDSVPAALVEEELFHASHAEEVRDLTMHGGVGLQNQKGDETWNPIDGGPVVDCSTSSGLVPPRAQTPVDGMHVKQALEMGSEDFVHSVDETVESTSSPHINVIRGEHDVAPSSNGEPSDTTSPTDTVATSIAEVPSNVTETPEKHADSSQCASLSIEIDIDEVGSPISPIVTHAVTEQLRDAGNQDLIEIEDMRMTDIKKESQEATQSPPIIADASAEIKRIRSLSPPDEKFLGRDVVSSTEEISDEESSRQSIGCVPGAQNIRPSSPSATSVSPVPGCDNRSLFTKVPQSPIIGQDTFLQDTDIEYSATEHQAANPLLPGLQLHEATSNIDPSKSYSPTNCSQHPALSHAAAIEPTAIVSRPELPVLVPASQGPSISLAIPAPSPINDMSPIMLALAMYRLDTAESVLGLKWPFACVEPVVDVTEGPATKKRKLSPSIESAVEKSPGANDVVGEDHGALEAPEQSLAKEMVVEEAREREEDSTVLDSQNKAVMQLDSAVICTQATNSVRTDAEAQVDSIATLGANMPTEEASANPADPVAPLMAALSNSAEEGVKRYKERNAESHERRLNSDVLPWFTGPCVQTTDVDMREHITSVSLSPPPELSISAPNSISKPREPGINFKPLQPATDQEPITRTEALDSKARRHDLDEAIQEQLACEMDIGKSNKPSEADEESSSKSAIPAAVAVKTEEARAIQDTVAAPNASTPAPQTQAVSATAPPPQITDPQTRPVLLRELDLGYGRRMTRSQTHSTEEASSTRSKRRHDEPNPVAEAADVVETSDAARKDRIAGEAARAVKSKKATEARSPRSTASARGKRNQHGFVVDGAKRRRTRSEAMETDAKPNAQAASRSETAPRAKPAASGISAAKSAVGGKTRSRTRSIESSTPTPTQMPGAVAEANRGRRLRSWNESSCM